MRFGSVLSTLALVALAAPAPAQQAAPSFAPGDFRAHVEFLSSDLLEGRDTGTRGYDLAASYVATRFQGLGLAPAAPGGFHQSVPFAAYRVDGPASLTIGGRSFAHGGDVLINPPKSEAPLRMTVPLVFAGYGLDLPAQGFDDYAGLDVRGKAVVVLSGYPQGVASELGAHLSSSKARMAGARGAVATIVIGTAASMARTPWERQVERAGEPSLTWLDPAGKPFDNAPGLRFQAYAHTPAAQALFAGAPRTLEQVLAEAARPNGKPKGFALKPTVGVDARSAAVRTRSPNVVAMMPGSDPKLANEYVLLMAHLDHVGVKPAAAPEGDAIHNGAMDNASGIATMLEVARAMAEAGARPKRPILFAAVTAEEKGLLGSQYLAKNPLPGIGGAGGKIVGVVNLDMPVLLYDFSDVIAFGGEHSTLGATAARAVAGLGLKVSPDPIPEEGIFTRSDHYRFVQEGVPSIFLMTGFAGQGEARFRDFLKTHYHRPSDSTALPFNWASGAKFAAINYAIAREIADAPQAPRWYRGNFFGDTFAGGQPKAAPAR
ncbi:MAG: Gll4423 protein [uncultured Sphingomonadaceae bacterium]|uniref:Gll4423 protein n=1 Tax=uncultured Sphingomonadaceae bacterium TaxID=169976 RepID=A0A6J4S0J7_9SPHN|nr:MAG: Gll4423 protein [uncultured Sphingomonadaceae bacterium]